MMIENITIADLRDIVLSISSFLVALGVILKTTKGTKEKIVDETIQKAIQPINESLENLREDYKTLSEELGLLIQLNLALTSELQEGKIDGKTSRAVEKLNDYLIKQATNNNNK